MPSAPPTGERELVEAIRRGDEDAFVDLVERYHATMLRLARVFVPSRAVAEEVVQETWLAMIQGIDRFEGRSSLKTWLFRILTNRAKTRGVRESRVIPASSAWNLDAGAPAVDPDRFDGGEWTSLPNTFPPAPDDEIVSKELRRVIEAAVRKLPAAQQEVITMRDVEGLESKEVCSILGLSEGNQRVLLHRARAKVREAVERYFEAKR